MVGENTVTEEIVVGGTDQIRFGFSGGEETPPASVVEEVERLVAERYDIHDEGAGTVLGLVEFDPESGDVVDVDWQESSTRAVE